MLKVIEKTKLWFTLSTIIIVIGLSFTVIRGLNFGIDFKGGTNVVIELGEGFNKPEVDEVVKAIVPDAITNELDKTQYEIKDKNLDTAKVSEIFNALKEKYDLEDKALISQEEMGASVGKELTRNSIVALIIACIAMLLYIAFRFEMDYGLAAVLSLLHDVLITISVYAIFDIPVNTPFIAAVEGVIQPLGHPVNKMPIIGKSRDGTQVRGC